MRTAVAVLAGLVVAGSLSACGERPLAKAYARYESKVDPLLEGEAPIMKRFVELMNQQFRDVNPDREAFVRHLQQENLPFYEELSAKVHALEPGDPGLAEAQALLVKYADHRRDTSRSVNEHLDVIQPGASEEALTRKSDAANEAMQQYKDTLDATAPNPDPRFTDMNSLAIQFATKMGEFTNGRASTDDVRTAIRERILPRVHELRGGKFGDDAASQALLQAIARSEEFYEAVAENLPRLGETARLQAEIARRTQEGDEILKKFKAEMAAVRRRF
jgi:hypothetical protein